MTQDIFIWSQSPRWGTKLPLSLITALYIAAAWFGTWFIRRNHRQCIRVILRSNCSMTTCHIFNVQGTFPKQKHTNTI